MGGSFGGGAGGIGGAGGRVGKQALFNSSAGVSNKMINPDIYFAGDVFHLMYIIFIPFYLYPRLLVPV